MKLNWINRDLRHEDFNLGMQFSAQFGVSPAALGAADNSAMVRLEFSRGAPLGAEGFVLPRVSWESRIGAERANAILRADILAVRRFATRRPQTLLGHLRFDGGRELDPEVQFFADAFSGLRGYRLHAFEGEKILVINAEHRIFFGRELLQLISPGLALFVDAGTAARKGDRLRLDALKVDAGVGLRIGLTRTPKNVLRVDLAWAFDEDPLGRKGLLLSVSMSQAF